MVCFLEARAKEMVGEQMKYIAAGLVIGLVLEGIWAIQDRDPFMGAFLGTAAILTSALAYAGKVRS